MKIRCKHCETVYKIQGGACPKCGKTGGYAQEPRLIETLIGTLHIEETIEHIESKNKWQIKEIQGNGMIVVLTYSPIVPAGARAYLSNSDIMKYQKEKK